MRLLTRPYGHCSFFFILAAHLGRSLTPDGPDVQDRPSGRLALLFHSGPPTPSPSCPLPHRAVPERSRRVTTFHQPGETCNQRVPARGSRHPARFHGPPTRFRDPPASTGHPSALTDHRSAPTVLGLFENAPRCGSTADPAGGGPVAASSRPCAVIDNLERLSTVGIGSAECRPLLLQAPRPSGGPSVPASSSRLPLPPSAHLRRLLAGSRLVTT